MLEYKGYVCYNTHATEQKYVTINPNISPKPGRSRKTPGTGEYRSLQVKYRYQTPPAGHLQNA